jgi:hypothetical protein
MRPLLGALSALLLLPLSAEAQTPSAPPAGVFENITIGEPMVNLRPMLGDPIRVDRSGDTVIWRYLAHGAGIYIDVIVKNNVAQSVTLLSRFDGVAYTDSKGTAFGMTPDETIAKLGAPTRRSTNADDGSLDLWYFSGTYAWIYEFHGNKLDFIQLIAAPALLQSLAAGPPAEPNDGTSLERAIWIRPANFLAIPAWIDVFLSKNACGNAGHWKEMATKQAQDSTKSDLFAYTIVHARCTDGSVERDFYFDTRGALKGTGKNTTIYVDPNQPLYIEVSPSPSPSAHPDKGF